MTVPWIDVSVWQLAAWIGLAGAVWFYGMSLYGAWDFFRHRREEDEPVPEWTPAVTVLKPLKGLETELYENLASFCGQAYPRMQIVFGVADAADPAIKVVRELQRAFPAVDMTLVIDDRLHGTNYKVSNLVNMYARAKHEVLVLSDSDIRVPQGYLRRIVAPLRHRRIGLVSCLYRSVGARDLPGRIESLFINTDFCHQVLVARQVETPRYAFGASMAMRRETLEEVGGFRAVANLLADDFFLGHRVEARGYELWLSDCVVETVQGPSSFRRLAQHQVRWARTFRNVRGPSYFATIMVHGPLWAAVNLAVAGFTPTALAVSSFVIGARMGTVAILSRRFLDTNLRMRDLPWVVAKDLFNAAVWVNAFLGNTVWWSGRRFRVRATGEMELIGIEAEREAMGAPLKQPS
jgi:ceramide glucosyltransferase